MGKIHPGDLLEKTLKPCEDKPFYKKLQIPAFHGRIDSLTDFNDIVPKVGKDYYSKEYWKDNTVSGYMNYNEKWDIHRRIGKLMERVLAPIPKKAKVLDYGGAFGYHADQLNKLVPIDGYLVDASEYGIENCAESVRGKAHHVDVGVDKLPFEDSFFDRVIGIEIMEHIYFFDIEFAIGELLRVMKPGAIGYFSIDIQDRRDFNFIDQTHQTMRPMEWWRHYFSKAGFILRDDLTEGARKEVIEGRRLVEHMKWNVLMAQKPS